VRGQRETEMRERVTIGLLLTGAFVLFAFGLGDSTLWDQDEARYTQIAREILQTGDFITMHHNGTEWFVHPPLWMWLVALTGWLFGFSEFTARIWSAVFGVVGVYATYLLGRMLFSARAALLGSIVLITTLQYFVQSRLAVFDTPLIAFMLLATYAFLRGVRERRRDLILWAAAWAGLGTLTKGPIALILPSLALLTFFALRRAPVPWRWIPWRWAILIYSGIGLTWYVLEWWRHGFGFIYTVVGYYLFNRFFGVVEAQSGPWWYYLPVFGIGAFPWTAFLVVIIPYLAAYRRKHEGSLFVLVWCGVTVGFYTVAGTKLPNYVLPVYPIAALGIGWLWEHALAGAPRARAYVRVAFLATALALAVGVWEVVTFARMQYAEQFASLQRHLVTLGVALIILFAVAVIFYVLRQPAAAFAGIAAVTVGMAAVLIGQTLPLVEAHRPIKQVSSIVLSELRPGEPLVAMGISSQQTLLYYTNHRLMWVDSPFELLTVTCYQRLALIVTRPGMVEQWDEHLRLYGAVLKVEKIAEVGDLLVVRKDSDTPCRQPLIGR
jgi:4-amino-4-deoxy-L-arabinose transferase-like glycosyltransferase